MYLVAQISPFEWKKASVCNHEESDEQHDLDDEFLHHHSSNFLSDFEVQEKEDLMTNRETSITTKEMEEENGMEVEAYSNTSTLQQNQKYLRNMCVMNDENNLETIWINMKSRNFFQNHHARCAQRNLQKLKSRSSKVSDENLDIDDDGLLENATADAALKRVLNESNKEYLDLSTSGCDEHSREFDDESQSIELISYVNNFSLKNAFAWTLGTLLQSTSELYPKVF